MIKDFSLEDIINIYWDILVLFFKDCEWNLLNNSLLFQALDMCKHLEHLIIDENNWLAPKTIMNILKRCANLKSRKIKNCEWITVEKIDQIASKYSMKKCKKEITDNVLWRAFWLQYRRESKLISKYAGYRKWFQDKKELFAGIKNLYNLYYELSKKERPMTKAGIKEAIEDVLVGI